jgi:hypothetical protein
MDEPIPGVHSDPDLLGGTPVFIGTREFLDDFPTVDRALAIGVLEHLRTIVAHAPAAR